MKLTPFRQPATLLLYLSRYISTTTTTTHSHLPKQQPHPPISPPPNAMDLTTTTPPEEQPPSYIAAARTHGIPLRQSAPVKPGPLPLQLPILNHLRTKRVILASSSPRRKAMLTTIGLSPPHLEIWPSNTPEDLDKKSHSPESYVSATARAKCQAVYTAVLEAQSQSQSQPDSKLSQEDPAVVIAADTIIATRSGQILEKPRSEEDHVRMLKHLRDGRFHRVLTGICVMAPKADASHPGYEIRGHVEDTRVYFAREEDGLPDDVIESYVKTREGADKAGGNHEPLGS
ncbi:inosine triphosphate pyrophosphatase-like protein [Apiosordaria backusii]|uniref:Inosine triphosphate pyrophosphatase-like protein n=1 Tax=Apiosordaria backusii TaxID=314023 RepID=A0AA40B7X8_9PEZI|nr:inosine triphosphate pyrophosphatase-like protein [Apiosordaria backusii]